MRRILAATLFGLVALAVGWAVAGVEYPDRSFNAPMGGSVKDSVCSHASWRDTVRVGATGDYSTTLVGTLHVHLSYNSVYYWKVNCPSDDNDVGVWVYWLPAYRASAGEDSMLVRAGDPPHESFVPVRAWYFQGANATADSNVRYELYYEGKPQ